MRTIVAGNWKMNKDLVEARALVNELVHMAPALPDTVEMVIAPPYPYLPMAVEQVRGTRIQIAAQNCHEAPNGAFTGEVSAAMLKGLGVSACIVGHSERRQYFGETDAAVHEKIKALLAAGLTPIYCCGERKEEREADSHFDVVQAQMQEALGTLDGKQLSKVVVAYEPVWAIGTGLTATPEQAQEMHAFIREWLVRSIGGDAESVPILYGGSCTPANAEGLFCLPDINGGLIGGASLASTSFTDMVRIAGNFVR